MVGVTASDVRLVPPVLMMFCLLAMLGSRAVGLGPEVVAAPVSWLGVVPIALGLAMTTAGARQFARVGTNIKPYRDPTVMVTDGLYRWTRNPMYLGMVLVLVGSGLLIGTVPALVIAAAFAAVVDRRYIRYEEAAMHRRFGDAYTAYARRTRRWI